MSISKSLVPDQERYLVSSDLGLSYLQRLSVYDTSMQRGFYLLDFSVSCTVESLSLLYLLFYLDLYVLGDDAWIS